MSLLKGAVESVGSKSGAGESLRINIKRKSALVAALIVIRAKRHEELVEFAQDPEAAAHVIRLGKIEALAEHERVLRAQLIRGRERGDVGVEQLDVARPQEIRNPRIAP